MTDTFLDRTWLDRPLHRTEVDGVPVLWRDGPPPFEASLQFRVGTVDETFVTSGITHAVEHLAMRAVGPRVHEVNGSVELNVTRFVATGRPGLVVEHLEAVCRALSDLPTDQLQVELGVLEAEGDEIGARGALLGELYGARGAGLAGFTAPAQRALTADEVRDWTRRYFVRGNAVLALNGPPPEGLRLPLPEGPRVPLPQTPRRDVTGRRWVGGHGGEGGDGGVALGMLAEAPDARSAEVVSMAARILVERVERQLRHEQGKAYAVDGGPSLITPTTYLLGLTADSPERHTSQAVVTLLAALEAMAEHGPTQAELDHERRSMAEALTDPRSVWAATESAAADLLVGSETVPDAERLETAAGVTVEDIRAAFAAAAENAFLLLPEGVDPERDGWTEAPASTVVGVDGRVLGRRMLAWAPRGADLVHAVGEGVTLRVPGWPGGGVTARWSDVVGVGVDEGDGVLVVQTADGGTLPLRARDWRGGPAVVEDLRAHVPERLFFDAPGEDDEDG